MTETRPKWNTYSPDSNTEAMSRTARDRSRVLNALLAVPSYYLADEAGSNRTEEILSICTTKNLKARLLESLSLVWTHVKMVQNIRSGNSRKGTCSIVIAGEIFDEVMLGNFAGYFAFQIFGTCQETFVRSFMKMVTVESEFALNFQLRFNTCPTFNALLWNANVVRQYDSQES